MVSAMREPEPDRHLAQCNKALHRENPMQIAEVSEYNGWKIYTFSHEDKPDGWMSGDPVRHHAWGSAEEYRVRSSDRPWKAAEILKIFPAYFADPDIAHGSIKRELIRQIAAFTRKAEAEQRSSTIAHS
jgi:hypothetical protein